MNVDTLREYLDNPETAADWLRGLGPVDVSRAHANLVAMATSGLTLDLLAVMCRQVEQHLAKCADPDMALNNLERFVTAARNRLAVGTFFERNEDAMPAILQIFSASQNMSDLLVRDQESVDVLRQASDLPITQQALVDRIVAEVEALEDDGAILRALRRFKQRQSLRIAYEDIVREHSLPAVTFQISFLADAILEAALRAAWRKTEQKHGTPRTPEGETARFVVLAMGKLGGAELNYSSDIDLILVYDFDGQTDGRRPMANSEFFSRMSREMVRLLTEVTEQGGVYRVDLRLRPEGARGPMVISLRGALDYYDIRGRTWERQAYIKARPVAGSLELGAELLDKLTPWIYRRYLGQADISGIKALKRRIEKRADRQGGNARDVKTGHGGIRDIEFVIQFLQLLNGGDLPEIRTGNTIEGINRLESVGCLSNLESSLLEENYCFLRKIEHRLQIMFDLQARLLPTARLELRKLALRMGYSDTQHRTAREAFLADYREKTLLNRKILDHLLHDAFSDTVETEAEVDLVLDPDPPEERIAEVLGKYNFADLSQAYRNLMALSEETIRFLSTRRCRHFLASIAPQLLEAVDDTPNPDSTLVNLCRVSDSLGGKGVLWELFSFNQPSLKLYVELCAYSPFLSNILTSNPGMIDGLMDSLMLDKLPSRELLGKLLGKLCRSAEDIEPILHSFKNDHQLRVGVRDMLGKADIQTTTGALSDLAETCLEQLVAREYVVLEKKFGTPLIGDGPRSGEMCEMVILAMGKLGGREINYHSDLDLVFLYEGDGNTKPRGRKAESTTNQHFFSELAGRIIKRAGHLGVYGRLYEIDARLRPTGKSGTLATAMGEFSKYFAEGHGQLWERQALCRARAAIGSPRAMAEVTAAVEKAAFDHPWLPQHAEEIRRMRGRMEETASAGDVKRGPGGIVDIEFLVQMLQLKHGKNNPAVRQPNTLLALEALANEGFLSTEQHEFFNRAYRLLRAIEGRLRLTNATARDTLPDDPTELSKLARLLRYGDPQALLNDFEHYTQEIRRRFDEMIDAEGE